MNKIKIETIFDLMKNKEQRGFELLYRNHFRTIYGMAFTIIKNQEMSCDIVQNVFMKLYRLKEDRFPKTNEMTWLYKVTKNEALQFIRKEKPTISMDEVFELPEMSSSIDEFTDMESYYSMISTLSEKQKNVVTLKVLGGLSHREIAKILDKPIGTIQWIYNTSIKKLRRTLEAFAGIIFIVGMGTVKRLNRLLERSNESVPEMEGPIDPVLFEPFKDLKFVSLLILLVVVISISIIFFKKSEKIPTK